jgi:hypothetical protein
VKQARRISRTALVVSTVFAIALITWSAYAFTFTTQEQTTLFSVYPESEKIEINLQPSQTYNYTITLKTLGFTEGTGYSIGKNNVTVIVPTSRDTIDQWTRYFSDTVLQVNGSYSILITINNPNNQILNQGREDGQSSPQVSLPLNFEFIESGNYTVFVENSEEKFDGTLIPQGSQVTYRKPLFDYGIIGIIILLLYPVLLFLSRKLKA